MITTVDVAATTPANPEDRVTAASIRMYNAEMALHIANQTGVEEWIGAAYARLHEAIGEWDRARAAEHGGSPD